MRRVLRQGHLNTQEATKYKTIRRQVEKELPDLIRRHQERAAKDDRAQALLQEILEQLKAARQKQGLSLADLTLLTGMDRSALSKLETGQRPNPTIETLMRYADAVGKCLHIKLGDSVQK